MIREVGEVVAVEGHWIQVQTTLKQGCSSCTHQNHCGAGLLSKALPKRNGIIHVPVQREFKIGERVELQLPEAVMLRFSIMLYGLPIVALAMGAGLAHWLFPGQEVLSILAAFVASGASFWWLRRYFYQRDVKISTCLTVDTLPQE